MSRIKAGYGLTERLARCIGTSMGQAMGPWAKENLRVR
jgi:hypothetical protein